MTNTLMNNEILSHDAYLRLKKHQLSRLSLTSFAAFTIFTKHISVNVQDLKLLLKSDDYAAVLYTAKKLEQLKLIEKLPKVRLNGKLEFVYKLSSLGVSIITDENGKRTEPLNLDIYFKFKECGLDSIRINYLATVSTINNEGHVCSLELANDQLEQMRTMNKYLLLLMDKDLIAVNESMKFEKGGRKRRAYTLSERVNTMVYGTFEDRERERRGARAEVQSIPQDLPLEITPEPKIEILKFKPSLASL